MNHKFLTGILTLVIAITLGSAAVAQSGEPLTADVPFDFVIGKERLPAGKYYVRTTRPGVLLIQHQDYIKQMFVQTIPTEPGNKKVAPSLVFNRYGKDHFLTKVWMGPAQTGAELRKGSLERELLASLANQRTTEQVALRK